MKKQDNTKQENIEMVLPFMCPHCNEYIVMKVETEIPTFNINEIVELTKAPDEIKQLLESATDQMNHENERGKTQKFNT